jgi:quercetin dioxygenase-like cupin family protein
VRDYKIDFRKKPWESPAPGIWQKAYKEGSRMIRLVEFTEEFKENDWCTKGHIGYVLEGRLSIDFDGTVMEFNPGDGLFIPEGDKNRHKGHVQKGEKALLVLFEETG